MGDPLARLCAPLDLYSGAPVTLDAFRHELESLGYERDPRAADPGPLPAMAANSGFIPEVFPFRTVRRRLAGWS